MTKEPVSPALPSSLSTCHHPPLRLSITIAASEMRIASVHHLEFDEEVGVSVGSGESAEQKAPHNCET
jgi:hypothetical protein